MNRVGVRGYSFDLKSRIVALALTGVAPKDVAQQFSVEVTTVRRYLQKHRLGTLALTPVSPGRPPRLTDVHEAQLLQQLDTHADATLLEHARLLEDATGLRVSFKTVDRAFARMKITHKKNTGRQRTA